MAKKMYVNVNGSLVDLNEPKVMAILNVTPDSFFSSSRYMSEEGILRRVGDFIDGGADIIDVGACSTRPGIELVSEEEELVRLRMSLHLIRKRWPEVTLSVDTFRSNVVRCVVNDFNVNIINDISGGEMDPDMFNAVSELRVPYILMHMQGTPETMQVNPHYDDLFKDICMYFSAKIEKLRTAGVNDIIIDPGFGFGKTLEDNYQLMRRLPDLSVFDLPILVGISRKSMIYRCLGLAPEESLNGTSVLNTISLMNGASILRVHDVREAKECVRLFDQYKKSGLCQ